jgi:hypothetical protein
MATYNKFNSFVAAVANKVHNLATDQLMVALSANATPPVAGNTQLSNITEIAYTNLSPRVLSVISSTQTGGLYKLMLSDLVLTASGPVAAFEWITIYNNTATNKELIAFFDYGSVVTMANGDTFTLHFDATNGLLQLT